ncbi:MAG: hypothetical protein H8E21_02930 [Gammaproteobacteria bacterium]|nr:hypothetical protein [Gammaproteobacteria bacterium]MBL6999408.1 hypothetical protein [Gammaproteobacteria bacterium]
MNQNSPLRLVDILALEPVAQHSSALLFWLLAVALMMITLYLALRYYRQPLRQLQRQLLTQQLSPRQAAHRLARIVALNAEQQAQLQVLRFAGVEPTAQAVLAFMRQLPRR